MTLFRQIYSLLFSLFLLVVASLGYVQFTETQSFLTKQMESDLNNASTSLGLMLTPALQAGDTAAAETLVNVIFEGGYYQNVKLTWMVDGKQQEWNNPLRIEDVPQWFINLNLFKTIKNKALLLLAGCNSHNLRSPLILGLVTMSCGESCPIRSLPSLYFSSSPFLPQESV